MKAALHRSLVFWLGLFVIAFLVWAWRDSTHYWSTIFKGRLMVASKCGGLVAADMPGRAGIPFSLLREPFRQPLAEGQAFPPPCLVQGKSVPEKERLAIFLRSRRQQPLTVEDYMKHHLDHIVGADRVLFIPYWLILLATASVWAGLLGWRVWRRKRRVAS